MERSIAQGPSSDARARPLAADARAGTGATVARRAGDRGLLLVVYIVSNPERHNFYNHFVWQAAAWLDGRGRDPLPRLRRPGRARQRNDSSRTCCLIDGPNGKPTGRALIPFPPLPAVVLMPFVAVWGLATDAQLVAALIGALDVGLAFWVLGRLPIRPRVRVATTLFLGLGTVFWYTAELGTTWYLAHVVAVGLTLLAIGVALSNDPVAAGGLARPRSDEPGAPGVGWTSLGCRRRRHPPAAAAPARPPASSWPGSCSAWPARPG